jgi:hypothetical protein
MENQKRTALEDILWLINKGIEGAKEFENYYYLYKCLVNEKPTEEGLDQARWVGAICNIVISQRR